MSECVSVALYGAQDDAGYDDGEAWCIMTTIASGECATERLLNDLLQSRYVMRLIAFDLSHKTRVEG